MIVFDDCFSTGESRICGLGGQKSRFHRHRTRPPGVDDCGRGRRRPEQGPIKPNHLEMRQGAEVTPRYTARFARAAGTRNTIKVSAAGAARPQHHDLGALHYFLIILSVTFGNYRYSLRGYALRHLQDRAAVLLEQPD